MADPEPFTDLMYLPGQSRAGDQQAQPSAHRQHNTFLAGLIPAASRGQDMLVPKTSHADSEELLRQPGATSNSWGVFFFPQRSLAPLPLQKDTPLPASQICNVFSLEVLPKESDPCSSSVLQAVSTQRHLSSAPSDNACITHFSNTSVSSDLRSCWFYRHTGSGFKSSFLLLLAELQKTSTRKSAWEIPLPTTQYCG